MHAFQATGVALTDLSSHHMLSLLIGEPVYRAGSPLGVLRSKTPR